MKKSFAFLFVAGMVTLAACGGKTEEAATETTTVDTTMVDTTTVAVDTAAAAVAVDTTVK